MSDTLPALAEEADRIHAEYRRNFAGRSRYTRDLSLLERLLAQTRDLVARAQGVAGADTELLPVLDQRDKVYETERVAIAKLKGGGPDEAVGYRTGVWSRLVRQRYSRNFAGKPRLDRDLGLLEALVADQRRWRDELRAAAAGHDSDWHADTLAQMDDNLKLFEGEAEQIQKARQGLGDLQRAQLMATLANGQFDSWRLHFQGRPRRARRPALLRRMISSLDRIHQDMVAARDAGVSESFHTGNIDNVAGRLPAWRQELERIELLRAQAGPDEIAGALGEDANEWFTRFRTDFAGKSRSTLDLKGLGDVCEALHEVGMAMEDQHTTWRRQLNARNLDIVLENLKAYEREHERAREAQKGTTA